MTCLPIFLFVHLLPILLQTGGRGALRSTRLLMNPIGQRHLLVRVSEVAWFGDIGTDQFVHFLGFSTLILSEWTKVHDGWPMSKGQPGAQLRCWRQNFQENPRLMSLIVIFSLFKLSSAHQEWISWKIRTYSSCSASSESRCGVRLSWRGTKASRRWAKNPVKRRWRVLKRARAAAHRGNYLHLKFRQHQQTKLPEIKVKKTR